MLGEDHNLFARQGARGRQVAPIPPVYEYEDYGEIYQDYGEEEEYPESQGGDGETYRREEGRGESEDNIEEQANDEQSQGGKSSQEETDDGECGPECRNLLHELEHPKEHERCPNAGMVIDIWGYCRYIVINAIFAIFQKCSFLNAGIFSMRSGGTGPGGTT